MSNYLEPAVDDESRPFWEGLERGALTLPVCMVCSRAHFYPRVVCPYCGSDQLSWDEMSGEGSVYSVTVSRRRRADGTPFGQVLALVDLDEGPRLLCEVRDGAGLAIDDRVVFAPTGELALPFFAPTPRVIR